MACVVIYILVNYHRHEKLLNDYEKNHNQVKFYVARDRDTSLCLYLGKPERSEQKFMPTSCGRIIKDLISVNVTYSSRLRMAKIIADTVHISLLASILKKMK